MSLRRRSDLFGYQADKMIPRLVELRQQAEFVQMGLGKTIGTLTALLDLGMPKTLVVAPARVTELDVWGREARRWEHTKDVLVNPLVGPPGQRIERIRNSSRKTHVDTISYNLFVWLCEQIDLEECYEAIVFDELSRMKHPGAKWFKRMRTRTARIPIRFGLTGNPVGNHMQDVWGELFAVAGEKPLGPSKVKYMMQYFTAVEVAEHVSMWQIRFGAEELIHERIKPWCFSLDPKDAPPLPGVTPNPIHVELPKEIKKLGDELTHELQVRLASGEMLTAIASGTRAQKFRQLASGAVYLDHTGRWEEVHRAKLDALAEVIDEMQGEPILVAYWYKHEMERILREFPQARVVEGAETIDEWNDRKIEMLLVHPASVGHGINMQYGGHNIVWFTLPGGSWELMDQMNARLARHGQPHPFVMAHYLCGGSADLSMLQSMWEKEHTEDRLKRFVEV